MSDYESAHFGGSDDEPWSDDGPVAPQERPQIVTSSSAPAHATHSVPAASLHEFSEEPDDPPIRVEASDSGEHVTVELTDEQCRIMGALIEKAFLTPDIYPMTTNAIATACNQKTNRDPVVSYTPVQIDGALMELRERNLVRRVHVPGSRSTKHRHTLDEALSLNDNELAIMSVLMLRGAQTVGELRLRTERHVDFPDLDATDACLEALASRPTPLVVQLARQPGQKEARWQHLIADPDSQAASSSTAESGHGGASAAAIVAPAAQPVDTSAADLEARVETLETEVVVLRRQLTALAEQLGETIE